MKKSFLALTSATLFISLVMLSSCKKDEEVTKSYAKVLVTHASPNAPGVDLLVDNSKQNTAALSFPSNTGYLQVEAGTRNIKVNVSGTSTTVINADLALSNDQYYSVFAIDSVSKISALVLTDDLTAPASGKAHVRFVHLSPNAPAVDVAVTGGGLCLVTKHLKTTLHLHHLMQVLTTLKYVLPEHQLLHCLYLELHYKQVKFTLYSLKVS